MALVFHVILSISAFIALCVKPPVVADYFLTPRADIQALQDLGLLYIPGALHNPGALIWGCPAILHINVLWALLLAGFVSCSFKRVDNSEQTIPDDSLPWQGWTDLARVGRVKAKRSTGSTLPF